MLSENWSYNGSRLRQKPKLVSLEGGDMNIGDYLDLEKAKDYPCSDGSIIHTVNVDALIEKVKADGRREVVEWVDKNWLDSSNLKQWQAKLKKWGID